MTPSTLGAQGVLLNEGVTGSLAMQQSSLGLLAFLLYKHLIFFFSR